MEYTIRNVERRTRRGLMPSLINPAWTAGQTDDQSGWYAEIELPDGSRAEVSRLDGEPDWGIDALWAANGAPIHSNGFGARYLIVKWIRAGTDIDRDLDAAVDAVSGTVTVSRGTI